MDIVKLAQEIAHKAHEGQFRKEFSAPFKKIPYIVHPRDVADLVFGYFMELSAKGEVNKFVPPERKHPYRINGFPQHKGIAVEVYYATAWLHDVVEDCGLTTQDLMVTFLEALKQEVVHNNIEGLTSLIKQWNQVLTAVARLSKPKGMTDYVHYLATILEDPVSRVVKVFDLQDNMKDLPAGSSQLHKYQLSHWFLQRGCLKQGDEL